MRVRLRGLDAERCPECGLVDPAMCAEEPLGARVRRREIIFLIVFLALSLLGPVVIAVALMGAK